MLKTIAAISIAAVLTVLTGCAGKDFVRPDPADLKIGRSSYSEVVAKMGEPRSTGEQLKNGETIKIA